MSSLFGFKASVTESNSSSSSHQCSDVATIRLVAAACRSRNLPPFKVAEGRMKAFIRLGRLSALLRRTPIVRLVICPVNAIPMQLQ